MILQSLGIITSHKLRIMLRTEEASLISPEESFGLMWTPTPDVLVPQWPSVVLLLRGWCLSVAHVGGVFARTGSGTDDRHSHLVPSISCFPTS